MTEAEMQTAVGTIRDGWANRTPFDVIEDRVRQALPAITFDDLAAACEQASDKLVDEVGQRLLELKAQGF